MLGSSDGFSPASPGSTPNGSQLSISTSQLSAMSIDHLLGLTHNSLSSANYPSIANIAGSEVEMIPEGAGSEDRSDK